MKKLDLHGVKHKDVQKVLDRFIWEAMNSETHQVEIITGKSSTMMGLVNNYLSEYQLIPIVNEINGIIFVEINKPI